MWDKEKTVLAKLAAVAAEMERCATVVSIEGHLSDEELQPPLRRYAFVHETETSYGGQDDEISF